MVSYIWNLAHPCHGRDVGFRFYGYRKVWASMSTHKMVIHHRFCCHLVEDMFLLAIISVSPSIPCWRMVFMIAQVFLLFATVFLHWFLPTFSNCHLHTANQVTGPGGLSALVGCPRTRITSYCSRGFEQINPCFILPEICNWCLGMRCLKLWIFWWVCQSFIFLDFWWASNPQGALASQFALAKN